jgi:hypothetical protein
MISDGYIIPQPFYVASACYFQSTGEMHWQTRVRWPWSKKHENGYRRKWPSVKRPSHAECHSTSDPSSVNLPPLSGRNVRPLFCNDAQWDVFICGGSITQIRHTWCQISMLCFASNTNVMVFRCSCKHKMVINEYYIQPSTVLVETELYLDFGLGFEEGCDFQLSFCFNE